MNVVTIFVLGLISGLFLTLMDRIDEHNLLTKNKTLWAYIFAILTAFVMILSTHYFHFLYPLLFGLCIEWILKNKIDYPSHVFYLFLMAFYFGHESHLFVQYWHIIALFLVLRFFTSVWLKNHIDKDSRFYRYFYFSYVEKLVGNVFIALAVHEYLILIYGIGFAIACLQTKLHAVKIKNFITSKYQQEER